MDRAGRLLPAALEVLVRAQPMSRGKLGFVWRIAVGAAIAGATEVHLGPDRALRVRGPKPWLDEIERSKSVVLARLRHLLGAGVVQTLVLIDTAD
jgi:hypothetical protein